MQKTGIEINEIEIEKNSMYNKSKSWLFGGGKDNIELSPEKLIKIKRKNKIRDNKVRATMDISKI